MTYRTSHTAQEVVEWLLKSGLRLITIIADPQRVEAEVYVTNGDGNIILSPDPNEALRATIVWERA